MRPSLGKTATIGYDEVRDTSARDDDEKTIVRPGRYLMHQSCYENFIFRYDYTAQVVNTGQSAQL